MKIVTLIENTSQRPDLLPEHGLSLYIETKHHKILFDTGASGSFANNAKKLGIDLSQVDVAVISHGHDDHAGGLPVLFEINRNAPIYLLPKAAEPHYNVEDTFIGIMPGVLRSNRLRYSRDGQQIGQGLTLFTCEGRESVQTVDTAGLTVLRDGEFLPDDFSHEQYLLIEEDGRKVLISGCSHKGILNIANWFCPDVLIGGFHFFKQAPDSDMVTGAAKTLLNYPTVYYTGHCTGQGQYETMKHIMGDRLHYLSTGTVVEL